MKSIITLSALVCLLLCGCPRAFNRISTYSDPISYEISSPSSFSRQAFEERLLNWCAINGYNQPSNEELSDVLSSKADSSSYKISRIIHLDPSRQKCELLITYKTIGNDVIFYSHAIREGSDQDHARQILLIEEQRRRMESAFPELMRSKAEQGAAANP